MGMDKRDIVESIYSAMIDEKERSGVYVTDICYDCLRFAYYLNKYGEYKSRKDVITLFIGKAVHTIPVFKVNELRLEWNGIVGRIDDYDPERKILLEKKTCRKIPEKPLEHHVKQVEYYKVLMEENGYKVERCFIAYLDIYNSKLEVFEVRSRASEIVKKEMLEKKEKLLRALLLSKPPERKVSWLCDYCPFFNICMREHEEMEH